MVWIAHPLLLNRWFRIGVYIIIGVLSIFVAFFKDLLIGYLVFIVLFMVVSFVISYEHMKKNAMGHLYEKVKTM